MSNTVIDEKTKVTLFAVLTIVPSLVYCVVFVVGLHYKAQANEMRIDKQSIIIDSQMTLLLDIRDRLIRLEENNKKNK